MPLWAWAIIFAALMKIPLAALMLWFPFRNEQPVGNADVPDSTDEDGGSKALPGSPLDPHPRAPRPRRPRRGPHGSPSPPAPPRVRRGTFRARPVRASR